MKPIYTYNEMRVAKYLKIDKATAEEFLNFFEENEISLNYSNNRHTWDIRGYLIKTATGKNDVFLTLESRNIKKLFELAQKIIRLK
jgi:hypothetical protein